MRSRWHHIPIFHMHDKENPKKVGWLELFYDLVFVAAFIQLGNQLSESISVLNFIYFCLTYICLWAVWTGFTYYSNRYNVDDILHRILIFIQMFAIGSMAISVKELFLGQAFYFLCSYSVGLFVVSLLYLRSYLQQKDGQDTALYWGLSFLIASIGVFGASFFEAPYSYYIAGLSTTCLLFSAFTKKARAIAELMPYDLEHLTERYGLLTIIVLGESFVKVLTQLNTNEYDWALAVQASAILLITCSLWWVYFDDVAGSNVRKGVVKSVIWVYSHIPLQIGIISTGVALKKASGMDLFTQPYLKYAWLLSVSLSLCYFSVALIDSVTERKNANLSDRARVIGRFISALLILIIGTLSEHINFITFLSFLTFICVAQILFDIIMAPIEESYFSEARPFEVNEIIKSKKPGRHRIDVSQAIRKGTPNNLRQDFFHYFIEGGWLRFCILFIVSFFFINLVFSALYLFSPGSIKGVEDIDFAQAFFFSVQTMTTIGYGVLSPGSIYGNIVVIFEAAVGILSVAFFTGMMFFKASKPKAKILFSDKIVINDFNGKKTLVFRVGNTLGTEIVSAEVQMTAIKDERTLEGRHFRKIYDINLVRSKSPHFILTWTLMHIIDESSPFYNMKADEIENKILSLQVTITGHNGTYSQSVHARHAYYPEDISYGQDFEDIMSELPDGRILIDYSKFHNLKV